MGATERAAGTTARAAGTADRPTRARLARLGRRFVVAAKPWALLGLAAYVLLLLFFMGFADRLIFVPPRPTYGEDVDGLVRLRTSDGESIAARWIERHGSGIAVLFAHGNAEDLGQGRAHAERYAEAGVSVLTFDYPGYGLSTGTPSEEGAYAAVDAAYDFLVESRGFEPGSIVAHGRSLGGAVVVDLASRRPVGGLVVESSFVSAYRLLTRIPIAPIDQFESLKKLPAVDAPVLVVHGSRDRVIRQWHGRSLFEAVPEDRRKALWVERAGHNDLAQVAGDEYWDALSRFARSIAGDAGRNPTH